jgi:hypothetical protein
MPWKRFTVCYKYQLLRRDDSVPHTLAIGVCLMTRNVVWSGCIQGRTERRHGLLDRSMSERKGAFYYLFLSEKYLAVPVVNLGVSCPSCGVGVNQNHTGNFIQVVGCCHLPPADEDWRGGPMVLWRETEQGGQVKSKSYYILCFDSTM